MNNTSHGAELVARWRNGAGQNNPAGPLFAAGEFAEADIVHATAKNTSLACSAATGSCTINCC